MSARLAGLFLAAVLGVLLAVGLAVSMLGSTALILYLAGVLAIAVPVVRKARSLKRMQSRPGPGQTCTCCTSTVHDPVQVV